jgi:hypothetical protein
LTLAHPDDVVVLRIHRLPVGRRNGGVDGFDRWQKASISKKEIWRLQSCGKTLYAKPGQQWPEYQRCDDDPGSFMWIKSGQD